MDLCLGGHLYIAQTLDVMVGPAIILRLMPKAPNPVEVPPEGEVPEAARITLDLVPESVRSVVPEPWRSYLWPQPPVKEVPDTTGTWLCCVKSRWFRKDLYQCSRDPCPAGWDEFRVDLCEQCGPEVESPDVKFLKPGAHR